MTTYTVTADAKVTRSPCRTITVPGPGGVPLHCCTCRHPVVRTAIAELVLHAGDDVHERLAGAS